MMRYTVTVDGESWEVEVDGGRLRIDGDLVDADLAPATAPGVHALRIGSARHRVIAARGEAGRWELDVGGRPVAVEVVDERTRRLREMRAAAGGPAGPRPLRAPMPGLVVTVEAVEGAVVEAGDGLVIVEAMKMENELRAEARARVSKVLVAAGDTVDKDQLLVELEPADEADS